MAFFVYSSTMWHLYILYSAFLDKYYIGYTGMSLQDRLTKHLSNHSGFTGRAKDWVIVYSESFELKSDAIRRERQLKALKSRTAIAKLILENSNEL